MERFEQLVKALRIHTSADIECDECAYYEDCYIHGPGEKMIADAADAIEALQAQLPKRGEWIDDEFTSKCRCSICGEEWSWFDNCTETFKYCPNCGAKMEVQDDKW